MILIIDHSLKSREGSIALRAFGLETHPEFKALDVTKVFAEGELLQPISFLVVRKTDEASDNAMVRERVSVGDHAHLDKVLGIHTLLQHIVDAILAQSLHSRLVLLNRLLNVRKRAFVKLIGHLLVMVHSPQELKDRFLD